MKRSLWIRLGLAALVALGIAAVLHWVVLAGHQTLAFRLAGRDLELLEPRWLYLLCGLPYVWLVLIGSLSDLSVAQQTLGAGIRSVVFALPATDLAAMAGGDFLVPCRELFARASQPVHVVGPVLADDARPVHEGYWSQVRAGQS